MRCCKAKHHQTVVQRGDSSCCLQCTGWVRLYHLQGICIAPIHSCGCHRLDSSQHHHVRSCGASPAYAALQCCPNVSLLAPDDGRVWSRAPGPDHGAAADSRPAHGHTGTGCVGSQCTFACVQYMIDTAKCQCRTTGYRLHTTCMAANLQMSQSAVMRNCRRGQEH
jgi:hypothetical protein